MARARKNLGDRTARHDAAYRQAKQQNFASRAIYKLAEIDQKFRILKPGQSVLDLGCWPGSWMQYVAGKIGSGGYLLGVDRKKVEHSFPSWVEVAVADIWEWNPLSTSSQQRQLTPPAFDVVLSDLAPQTTGDRQSDQWRSEELCLRALEIAQQWLQPRGHFVVKVFQGQRFSQLLSHMRSLFQTVKPFHPKNTRERSIEQYIVARSFKATAPTPE